MLFLLNLCYCVSLFTSVGFFNAVFYLAPDHVSCDHSATTLFICLLSLILDWALKTNFLPPSFVLIPPNVSHSNLNIQEFLRAGCASVLSLKNSCGHLVLGSLCCRYCGSWVTLLQVLWFLGHFGTGIWFLGHFAAGIVVLGSLCCRYCGSWVTLLQVLWFLGHFAAGIVVCRCL